MKPNIFTALVAILFVGAKLNAFPIKISFLDSEIALKETTDFLTLKGCDSNSVGLFKTVVNWNNESPLGFDLEKFPKKENGFYSFQSVSNLVGALTQPLIKAAHPYQLNCFDNVVLLAGNLMQTGLQPDELSGPFLVPVPNTNSFGSLAIEETARDAFNTVYPSWHIEASKAVFRENRQNKRICLTAVFDSYCILPRSVTKNDLGSSLLKVLQTNWKRQRIIFPTNMEIVICHSATLNDKSAPFASSFANATHAGLLFQDHDRYVYLEKDGVSGPYVRLDFTNKKDLLPWLRSVIESTTGESNHLFATFNDREIESLDEAGH